MTLQEFRRLLKESPLIVSVQASPGSVMADNHALALMAQASLDEGVKVLRLEGVESIRYIKSRVNAPVMGLIKQPYPDFEIYISPTRREVEALIEAGCEIVALDATCRPRPDGSTLAELVSLIHQRGRLAMGDCDTPEAVLAAQQAGCDIVSTTLAGYTSARSLTNGPDLEALRWLKGKLEVPLMAEGRFVSPHQLRMALRLGATGVVIGGAINDPTKQTRRFGAAAPRTNQVVDAFDVGGTWIRHARVLDSGIVGEVSKESLPASHKARLEWMSQFLAEDSVVGISAGGTIEPKSGEIWESLDIIPGQINEKWKLGDRCYTLNDGLATAWGHASHPQFAGLRSLTLAIGTGLGAGFVDENGLCLGKRGEYPRLNELEFRGKRLEDVLSGTALGAEVTETEMSDTVAAVKFVYDQVCGLYAPDVVVVCGGVGLAPWLTPQYSEIQRSVPIYLSPYAEHAGLMGAAWLALMPPEQLQ